MRGPNSAAEEVRVSAVIGSDPDQLDQLAATMLACADRLDGVRSELAFVLASSPWQGGDADDFRWQWGHQLAGLLQGASTAFREAGARVRGDAGQQRQASADDGAGAGSPSAGRAGGGGGGGGWAADPLGIAAAFGLAAMNVLGFASGVVSAVHDAHHGLIGGKWAKSAADQVVRLAEGVRVGAVMPLRIAGEFLEKKALLIDGANTVIAGAGFVQEAGKDPRSKDTFDAGVSTLFGVASVGAGVVGVAALAVGAAPVAGVAAGVGFGLFAGEQVWEEVSERTEVDEWLHQEFWKKADQVGETVHAAGDIINGGLNALLGR
jgi:hypothetical protein